MSDIAYRFKEGGRGIFGIPARDITVAEFEAMTPDQRRAVKHLEAYEKAETPELDDPLRSLSNEEYAQLTPPEKAARTREAKRIAEEAERAAQQGSGDPDPQEPTTGDAEEGE